MTSRRSNILTPDQRKKARRCRKPSFHKPMLAKLTHDRFSDDDWIYERKLDGERCLAVRSGKKVTLYSRNRKKINDTYPEVVDGLSKQPVDRFAVDGEVVAFDGKATSFERLQQRMQIKESQEAKKSSVAVYYYVFDVLHVDGYDVDKLPLEERKKALKKLLTPSNRIRMTQYRRGDGESYLKEACRKKWEGLIAKDFQSSYAHSRSSNWLKFKCGNRQEFVICGFTEPRGEREQFGALLIGYYDGDDLRYAGKVGTGHDDETLESLGGTLKRMERKSSPIDDSHPSGDQIHWVRPKLVAEIGFTEWTRAHRLRHPRFIGLRRDKKASEVVREG